MSASVDILLIEDDLRLAELTSRYFQQSGLSVVIEPNGSHAIDAFRRHQPRIVLLDLMLPGVDGLTICSALRKIYQGPILILTAKDADIDHVIGLEAGADDYVIKPVDPMVLLTRIRVLLNRIENRSTNITPVDDIVFDKLRISLASQQVWLNKERILLTTQEFELLVLLANHAGTILSREDLFQNIRGIDYNGLDRSIDVRISKLRKKLHDNGPTPSRIVTVWGKGYLFVPDAWQ